MFLQPKHTEKNCTDDGDSVKQNQSSSMPSAAQCCRLRVHDAIKAGDVELAIQLIASGGDIRQVDDRRNTPLHLAAATVSLRIVEALLILGVDPSALNIESETPLHTAIHACQDCRQPEHVAEIVELLLQAGSNPNSRNLRLETPLQLVKHYRRQDLSDQDQWLALARIEANLLRCGARPSMLLRDSLLDW